MEPWVSLFFHHLFFFSSRQLSCLVPFLFDRVQKDSGYLCSCGSVVIFHFFVSGPFSFSFSRNSIIFIVEVYILSPISAMVRWVPLSIAHLSLFFCWRPSPRYTWYSVRGVEEFSAHAFLNLTFVSEEASSRKGAEDWPFFFFFGGSPPWYIYCGRIDIAELYIGLAVSGTPWIFDSPFFQLSRTTITCIIYISIALTDFSPFFFVFSSDVWLKLL